MDKEIKGIKQVYRFVDELIEDGNFVISIFELGDNIYSVQWLDRKYYTDDNGQEVEDEVWMSDEGEMIFVQDLPDEKCRGILRDMIANFRDSILNELDDDFEEFDPDDLEEYDDDEFSTDTDIKNRTLH